MRTLSHRTSGAHRRNAFTLIELLVVIAIIMMLVALLMPAAAMLRQTAKRKQAAARAQSICQAAKNYRQTYGKFPGQDQGVVDQDIESVDFYEALTNNPRKKLFMEVGDNEVRPAGGTDDRGVLQDPWERLYVIAMDENGDGVVDMDATIGSVTFTTNVVGQDVCVMSWGYKPEDPDSRVYSWRR